MITPEQFAEVLCDDLELPSSSFSAAIASSIRQQCEQFSGDMIPDDEEDRRVIIKVCMHQCTFAIGAQSLTALIPKLRHNGMVNYCAINRS